MRWSLKRPGVVCTSLGGAEKSRHRVSRALPSGRGTPDFTFRLPVPNSRQVGYRARPFLQSPLTQLFDGRIHCQQQFETSGGRPRNIHEGQVSFFIHGVRSAMPHEPFVLTAPLPRIYFIIAIAAIASKPFSHSPPAPSRHLPHPSSAAGLRYVGLLPTTAAAVVAPRPPTFLGSRLSLPLLSTSLTSTSSLSFWPPPAPLPSF